MEQTVVAGPFHVCSIYHLASLFLDHQISKSTFVQNIFSVGLRVIINQHKVSRDMRGCTMHDFFCSETLFEISVRLLIKKTKFPDESGQSGWFMHNVWFFSFRNVFWSQHTFTYQEKQNSLLSADSRFDKEFHWMAQPRPTFNWNRKYLQ